VRRGVLIPTQGFKRKKQKRGKFFATETRLLTVQEPEHPRIRTVEVTKMTYTKDLKMAALAAMILLATAVSGKGENRMGDVESIFTESPRIETQILAG
jgi:hypothetical protein